MPSLVGLGFHPPLGWPKTLSFTGSIARSETRRYLIYSEADFEFFRPAVVTRCTDRGEIWRRGGDLSVPWHAGGDLSVPNFTPIGATIGV